MNEIGQKPAEGRPALLTCRHCGQPATLEECWDDALNACGRSVVLMIYCACCGIRRESPYGSTVGITQSRIRIS